jgi:hypothetical protein
MTRIARMLLTIQLMSPVLALAQAPVSRPTSKRAFEVPMRGNAFLAVFASINNYQPGTPPEQYVYHYAPLLSFVIPSSQPDSIEIEAEAADAATTRVSIPVFFGRADLPLVARDYALKGCIVSPSTREDQFQSLPLKSITIRTINGYTPEVRFSLSDNPILSGKITLVTTLPNAQAASFVRDLKAGTISFLLKCDVDGFSYHSTKATLDYDRVQKNKMFNDLTGPGRPNFVTRQQVAKLGEVLLTANQIKITGPVTDYLKNLISRLLDNQALSAEQTIHDWKELGSRFVDLGFDPTNFKADLIKKSEKTLKTTLHQTFKDKIEQTANVFDSSFSWWTMSGTGNDDFKQYSRDIFQDVLSDYGLQTKVEGDILVPKNIDIFRNNLTSLKDAKQDLIEIGDFQEEGFTITISGSTRDRIIDLPSGSLDRLLEEMRARLIPIGTVLAYAGNVNESQLTQRYGGVWMICDGRALNSHQYPELWDAIGTGHGGGYDPDVTAPVRVQGMDFNIPDLRGRFVRGANCGAPPNPELHHDPEARLRQSALEGGARGDATGSIQYDAFKLHNHDIKDPGHTHLVTNKASLCGVENGGGFALTGNISTDDGGCKVAQPKCDSSTTLIKIVDKGGLETRPVNISLTHIIRVR